MHAQDLAVSLRSVRRRLDAIRGHGNALLEEALEARCRTLSREILLISLPGPQAVLEPLGTLCEPDRPA